MQAIITTFHVSKGNIKSHIRAHTASGHSTTYQCSESTGKNHLHAASKLVTKMDWPGVLHGGCTREGWAWLCMPETSGPLSLLERLSTGRPETAQVVAYGIKALTNLTHPTTEA